MKDLNLCGGVCVWLFDMNRNCVLNATISRSPLARAAKKLGLFWMMGHSHNTHLQKVAIFLWVCLVPLCHETSLAVDRRAIGTQHLPQELR